MLWWWGYTEPVSPRPPRLHRISTYFWSRKDAWVTLVQLSDDDPLFNRFLQAGAARVQVPTGMASTALLGVEVWDADGYLINPDDPGGGEINLSMLAELKSQLGNDYADGPGTVNVTQGSDHVVGAGTTSRPMTSTGASGWRAVSSSSARSRELIGSRYRALRSRQRGCDQLRARAAARWRPLGIQCRPTSSSSAIMRFRRAAAARDRSAPSRARVAGVAAGWLRRY